MSKLDVFVTNNRKYVTKVVIDVLSILAVGLPIFILFLVGQPFKRGFNCDDESIRYPYRENTISSVANYFYSTGIPVVSVVVIETARWYASRKYSDNRVINLSTSKPSANELIWKIYCVLAPFAFGAVISQCTTDIAKYTIGRLRPHFIDVCEPRTATGVRFTLDNVSCTGFQYRYITDFECSSTRFDERRQRDAKLSFMSGHSSFAAYCLVFFVIYLQRRLKWSTVGFIRPLFQAVCIYIVIYTGFTRISDYKHHWSDVLIGLLQGTVVAILTAVFISDLFVKKADKNVVENGSLTPMQPNMQSTYNSFPVEMEESIRKIS